MQGLAIRRSWFEIVLSSAALFLAIWPSMESQGVNGLKIENITIDKPSWDWCDFYSITLKWYVDFNRTDAPTFKLWLTTRGNEEVRNITISKPQRSATNSFQSTFKRIFAALRYTAHVEATSTKNENLTSYANASVKVNPHKPGPLDNVTVDGRYIMVTWKVLEKYQRSLTPVTYNIGLCVDESVYACYSTLTMCRGTYQYNASTSSGQGLIQLYEQNWKQHWPTYHGEPPNLLGSWNSTSHRFTCSINVNACTTHTTRQILQYSVHSGNDNCFPQSREVILRKGSAFRPEFIKINMSTNKNHIVAEVHWRFRVVCEEDPATNLEIVIEGPTSSQKSENLISWIIGNSKKRYIDDRTKFLNLRPYSKYTVKLTTSSRWGSKKIITTKTFWTNEGVPESPPRIDPIIDGVNDCIEKRRNVTVNWKLPAKEYLNGYVRNISVKYFEENSKPKEIFLPNVTSTELSGLYCDVEYQVEVRACLHGNESCSPYSESARIIKAEGPKIATRYSKENGSNLVLWVTVSVGLVLVIVAMIVCVRVYRRKRRRPLEELTEANGHPYDGVKEAEISEQQGNYVAMDDEVVF